jgi:hypothetical protein
MSSVYITLGRHSEKRIEDGSSFSYEQPHIYDTGFLLLDELDAVLRSIFRISQWIQKMRNVWKLKTFESLERQLSSTTKQALDVRHWNKGILNVRRRDEET